MRKMRFALIAIIVGVFLVFSCRGSKETELDTAVQSRSAFIGNSNKVGDLLDRYNLSISSAGIWNDCMPDEMIPGGATPPERFSICTIWFLSNAQIPKMDVFATVTTERATFSGLFQDIYNGEGTYGEFFLKDFRPVEGFRLNDGEEYTLEVIVKISGEIQVIAFEKREVFTAW